jgi:hypothetical protein
VLVAGGLGKAVYCLACAGLVLAGVGKPLVLLFGLGDLAMAGLFAWAFMAHHGKHAGRSWRSPAWRMLRVVGR